MSVVGNNQENDPVFQNSPIKLKGGPTAKQPAFVFTPSKGLSTPTKNKSNTRSPLQPLTKAARVQTEKSPTNSPHRLTPSRTTAPPAKTSEGSPLSLPKTQITPSSTPPASPSRKHLRGKRTPTSASKAKYLSSAQHSPTLEEFQNDPRLSPQAALALTTRFRQLATRTPPPQQPEKEQTSGEEVTEHPLSLPPVQYDKFGFEMETPIKSLPYVDPDSLPSAPQTPSMPFAYSRTFARPPIPTPLRNNNYALWETILADWSGWQDERLKSLIVLKVSA